MSRLPVAAPSDHGASSVEYGILVAAIAAVAALVIFALGLASQGTFADACDGFNADGVIRCA